jgi:hypothetical protein
MSNRSLVSIWLLFAITIFCTGYLLTHIIVTRAMADFKVTETGYTSLEVKENTGTQTDNQYKVQPAKNVQEQ